MILTIYGTILLAVGVIISAIILTHWAFKRMKRFSAILLLAFIVAQVLLWITAIPAWLKILISIYLIYLTIVIKEKKHGPLFPDNDYESYGRDSDEVIW